MAEFRRLFDAVSYQKSKHPKETMLASKNSDGSWKQYSTEDVERIVNQLAVGFLKLGIGKDDKVAIISSNRPEWNFVDLATLSIGAVDVPIYPTITESDFEFIFNDARVRYVFVSDAELFRKVSNVKPKVESLEQVFTFDKVEGATHWSTLLEETDDFSTINDIRSTIKPDSLATIIYTSGTTGLPKGVMLSHNNIVSNVRSVSMVLPLESTYRALSFLPLCHIFERTVTYSYFYNGVSIYYAESMETIGDNLKEVRPQYFTTVPRLLEKVYDKIIAKGEALTGAKRKLFFWALELGHKFDFKGKSLAYKAQLALARKLIFSKWKEALGGEIIGIITGAAALQLRLQTVFNAAGIQVRQGYGMTETSPVITFDRFEEDQCKLGSVGMGIPGVEVKIDPKTDEICTRGPHVMMGYYNREDATREVIDEEGWMHTGDCGKWEEGKYLKITDRIKELFKTSGGKYVAPQPIENKFKESPFVEQIMVVGNDRKFAGALIVPNGEVMAEFCKKNAVDGKSLEDWICQPQVLDLFEQIKVEFNAYFGKTEQIKRFQLLSNEWTIDGGELTPTMKLKRKRIIDKYSDEIEKIYSV